ncbi:MAG: FecR domain-containing protein [Planctomycetaceae bacterium]|nr:FecR domain-containing protein [Planctomycetaceae bacterium]MCB9951822.1 FecR domain-containing protein [Planctomycetaceae bacterium]
MTFEELRSLIDDALEGTISEADFLRLEAELSVDPVARREYYDRVFLSTLLEAEAATQREQASDLNLATSDLPSRHWRLAFAALAAVCASLLLVIAWQWQWQIAPNGPTLAQESAPHEPGTISSDKEQQSSGFAILSGQADAVWGGSVLSTGGIVPPGEVRLESGLAQFELFSGVTLVVEGEAQFSILSPMEVSVASGKVRARVPEPAQGFRLLTNAGEVVDLGTEFAVNVSADESEVHVLDGEVEWHPTGLPAQLLKQGEATRSDTQGQTKFTADSKTFVGSLDLERRIRDQQSSRRDEWNEKSQQLAHDARLIAHYQQMSEAVAERRLPNLASHGGERASEGAVVAATGAQNRWGESASALDFSPAGSRVRLQVPGEHQNLTLICWVRINSLDRWYNSLFLTDGHEQGEPHWQIMDDGRLFFSVKKNDVWDATKGEKDKHIFFSPPFWDSSLSGRWLMIATVYDGTNRQVTHYLNGDVLSQEAIPEEYLVTNIRIGEASLCNWGLPERNQPRFAIRNLNGSMDEFLLFSAPLSAEEILELYEASQP